ncbi:hypothetical protein QBC46DRAFT_342632 [Diplogelasinospora grovesii]|uniref:Uncharacterized protein n=1 Tax=Diplogelasinospora grovesii TaxID=303347 RepID=A0AAN6S335_9PEZI|nr:hypothetical protein QBC46DRAFT_342632 [Diplogelasinospora grovesii]
MASPFTRFFLLLPSLCVLSCARSFNRDQSQHGVSVLRLHARNATGVPGSNPSVANATTAVNNAVCNFTQEYTVKAIKANCSAYIEPLESVAAFPPTERWAVSDGFVNCTYHELATQFPDMPPGNPAFAFRDGQLIVTKKPNIDDARRYGPPPPLKPAAIPEGFVKATPFFPIFVDAIEPFFLEYAEATPCSSSNSSGGGSQPDPIGLLQSFDIAAQQYTRCAVQSPSEDVGRCTVETTAKLRYLPASFFIYFGAPQCDSKLWSLVGVACSIVLDFLQIGALMYLRGTKSFSWLQFLLKLAAGLGEPAIQAVLLMRRSSGENSASSAGFVIAAMEFLQPTAAPLLAGLAGWHFSKGHGFQVLATDAVTTLAGVLMILGFTTMQVLSVLIPSASGGSMLVPIGLLCAVGPWLLMYLLFGFIAIPLQLGFMLGFVEAWLFETHYMFGVAFLALGILIVVVGFVAFTPIWALWELGWVLWQKKKNKKNKNKSAKVEEKTGEKPIFPLARYFRERFQNTSRFKRGLVKFVFWLFILMSFASVVGKWMFMVNILSLAGDAYCPSGYKEATFAGLGFKAVMLGAGVAAQFFSLTA